MDAWGKSATERAEPERCTAGLPDRGNDGPKANARDEQRAHAEQVKESQAMILDLLSERDVLKKWAVPGEVRDGQEGTRAAGWCGLARKQRSCAERVGRVPCGGPIC